VKDIRDLGHVIDREKAEIGIFITWEKPTKDMIKEAVSKGYYRSIAFNRNYPNLQIITVEELLSDKKPDIPFTLPAFKKAEKADLTEHLKLDYEDQ
jgi:site-specific DNA-methyltransferase (adenine-specific)